eukprot:14455522-Alexandrium_andersonii.AAC.1
MGLEPLSDPRACSAAFCNNGAQCVQRFTVCIDSARQSAIGVISHCHCARGRVRSVQCLRPCSCRVRTPPQPFRDDLGLPGGGGGRRAARAGAVMNRLWNWPRWSEASSDSSLEFVP